MKATTKMTALIALCGGVLFQTTGCEPFLLSFAAEWWGSIVAGALIAAVGT
jgi:hypothetical protein